MTKHLFLPTMLFCLLFLNGVVVDAVKKKSKRKVQHDNIDLMLEEVDVKVDSALSASHTKKKQKRTSSKIKAPITNPPVNDDFDDEFEAFFDSIDPLTPFVPNSFHQRAKDVDYKRVVRPSKYFSPIFKREKAKEFPKGSEEELMYWWNKPLRDKIEHYKELKKGAARPSRYPLNPVELHVEENFISKEDRIKVTNAHELICMYFSPQTCGFFLTIYGYQFRKLAHRYHHKFSIEPTEANNAKNLNIKSSMFKKASVQDREFIVDILSRVEFNLFDLVSFKN